MREIKFTNLGTVILDDREISQKKFFKKLEENIGNYRYGVYFNDKEGVFYIGYAMNPHGDYGRYILILTDEEKDNMQNNIYSPIILKLKSLSNVGNIIRIQEGDTYLNPQDYLDNNTKAYYLRYLENKTFNDLKKYFLNYWSCVKDAFEKYRKIGKKTEGVLYLLLAFVGAILVPIIGIAILNNEIETIFIFGGIGSVLPSFSIITYHLIKYRIETLIAKINEKRVETVKIKELKSIIYKDNEIKKIEEKHEEETIHREIKLCRRIPNALNEIIDSLNDIDKEERKDLLEEAKAILKDYQALSKSNNGSEILTTIQDTSLEERVKSLKNKVDYLINPYNGEDEIKYLVDKIQALEDGYSYQKRKL